jgi:hypothetical protein
VTNADNTITITKCIAVGANGLTIPDTNIKCDAINRPYVDTNVPGLPVTMIGTNAFEHQITVTNFVIPHSITNIGAKAFYMCIQPNTTIPASVLYIGEEAFYQDMHLDLGSPTVLFEGNKPELGIMALGNGGGNNPIVYYFDGTSGWTNTPVYMEFVPLKLFITSSKFTDHFELTAGHSSDPNYFTKNRNYVVETCTDLTDNSWIPLAKMPIAATFQDYSDNKTYFYRVRWEIK